MTPVLLRCLTLALVLPLLGPVATGQDEELPAWKVDPYTDNDAAAVRAAGWVRLGTDGLPWGDDHGTRDVEQVLGQVQLLWLETPHFRLGSSLTTYKVSKEDDREQLEAELARLSERLPGVRRRTRELDPWLRLHLQAQRLEELYQEFCDLLGVSDDAFEPVSVLGLPPDVASSSCLGQGDKFLVLLTEKKSSLARYGQRFGGLQSESPLRLNFPQRGSLFFGSSPEFFSGALGNERAFHCHVLWNVVQDLVLGYKGYRHVTPRWWGEGLGHWMVRRVEPRYAVFFSEFSDPMELALEEWDWPPKVRARVKHGAWPPAAQLLRWPRRGPRTLSENIMMWSRVDYLLTERRPGVRVFMDRLKDLIPSEPGTAPGEADVWARQDEALQDAFGLDAAGFDQVWSTWVLDSYPRR